MEFRTKVHIPPSPFHISHGDKLLLTGSCFTENIGHLLSGNLFNVIVNPFGTIYNPLSIFDGLQRIAENIPYSEDDLLMQRELYISLDHHGGFSNPDKMKVLDTINNSLAKAHEQFKESGWIVITLGTAFIYKHLHKNKVVANCHKIPATAFERRLLNIDEITAGFKSIKQFIKNKKVLFTISPVRHLRDGAIENQRSKSILIESVHRIVSVDPDCFYFPAYEIVMDELRDYRFYKEDMLHPNEFAVKYIWKRFSETYFSDETRAINREIEKIQLMLQHRVKHGNTEEEKKFRETLLKAIDAFKSNYPEINADFVSSSNTGISM